MVPFGEMVIACEHNHLSVSLNEVVHEARRLPSSFGWKPRVVDGITAHQAGGVNIETFENVTDPP